MTQAEAIAWLKAHLNVSRETLDALETFVAFLKREAESQNLISASTLDHIWSRHIVDSAQLLLFTDASARQNNWLDLGSGAGFPGLVIALLTNYIEMLDLTHRVRVAGVTLERLETAPYAVISARAFAPLPKLFDLAARFATNNTLWLLPKGRNAQAEWEGAQAQWGGNFRIMDSVTDQEAGILVGTLSGKRKMRAIFETQGQEK